jgi:ferrous iron transport protein A
MKLLDASKGKSVRIINYSGGKGVAKKLRQLGLTPGREVKVLRYAPMGGPIMVCVEGRSVALGRGIAARILVESIE